MALSEIQIAQARLSNARRQAAQLGDDARRQCVLYLTARKRWLEAVDRIDVLDREVDEKIAIERAFQERENHGKKEKGGEQPA